MRRTRESIRRKVNPGGESAEGESRQRCEETQRALSRPFTLDPRSRDRVGNVSDVATKLTTVAVKRHFVLALRPGTDVNIALVAPGRRPPVSEPRDPRRRRRRVPGDPRDPTPASRPGRRGDISRQIATFPETRTWRARNSCRFHRAAVASRCPVQLLYRGRSRDPRSRRERRDASEAVLRSREGSRYAALVYPSVRPSVRDASPEAAG